MIPTIPQKDNKTDRREKELSSRKRQFQYRNKKSLAPLAEAVKLPLFEKFDIPYLYRRSKPLAALVMNNYVNWIQHYVWPSRSRKIYSRVFKTIEKPTATDDCLNDRDFAWQRLAGVNPVVIRRVKNHLPVSFQEKEEQILKLIQSKSTLSDVIEDGRLYFTNYEILSGIREGSYLGNNKVVHDPIVLFFLKKEPGSGDDYLIPILIQLTQRGHNDIFISPEDGSDWEMAKWYCQVADAHYHQFVTHLTWSHLVFEPFPMATYRRLSSKHPVHVLLKPHFEYSLAINEYGRKELFKPNGYGENLFAASIDGLKAISIEAYNRWSFSEFSLEKDIKNRGMELLGDYPYRDDGLLVWRAIEKFIGSYLALYYRSDSEVIHDTELESWLQELISPKEGNVKGLPSSLKSINELRDILTNIVYISSVYHSVVNYPQWDFMGSPLNMATAAYADTFIKKGGGLSSSVDSDAFPPFKQLLKQMNFIYFISRVYHNYLGQYTAHGFSDLRAIEVIKEFQSDLSDVEGLINRRNGYRYKSYKAMLPSRIANSLNS